jgi:hypothetical protein
VNSDTWVDSRQRDAVLGNGGYPRAIAGNLPVGTRPNFTRSATSHEQTLERQILPEANVQRLGQEWQQ